MLARVYILIKIFVQKNRCEKKNSGCTKRYRLITYHHIRRDFVDILSIFEIGGDIHFIPYQSSSEHAQIYVVYFWQELEQFVHSVDGS